MYIQSIQRVKSTNYLKKKKKNLVCFLNWSQRSWSTATNYQPDIMYIHSFASVCMYCQEYLVHFLPL